MKRDDIAGDLFALGVVSGAGANPVFGVLAIGGKISSPGFARGAGRRCQSLATGVSPSEPSQITALSRVGTGDEEAHGGFLGARRERRQKQGGQDQAYRCSLPTQTRNLVTHRLQTGEALAKIWERRQACRLRFEPRPGTLSFKTGTVLPVVPSRALADQLDENAQFGWHVAALGEVKAEPRVMGRPVFQNGNEIA